MAPNKSDDQTPDSQDYDIFIADKIYPDAGSLFTALPEPVEAIKDKAVVVLDTNVLLLPFQTGQQALEEIDEVYRRLIDENRLVVPAQVAREFVRNRATKIGELFQQISRLRNNAGTIKVRDYPLLQSLDEYKEVRNLAEAYNKQANSLRTAIGELLDSVQAWQWRDPVSLLYARLFTSDVVVQPGLDKTKIREDLAWRGEYKVPPGYKDAGKDDEGIGDLLIWHTILLVARERQRHVIFVTADEKADWYHQSENQSLYPRFELQDEFRRAANGKSFHILKFSRFLDLYGAEEEVVQEVRKEEVVQLIPFDSSQVKDWRTLNRRIETAVRKWLEERFDFATISVANVKGEAVDYIIEAGQRRIGVETVLYRSPSSANKSHVRVTIHRAYYQVEEASLDSYMFCFVTRNRREALKLFSVLEHLHDESFYNFIYFVGFLDESGNYIVINE